MSEITPQNIHLYILNEKNKLLDNEFILGVLKKYNIDYTVKNFCNFQRAMIHKSYLHKEVCTDKILKTLKDVNKIEDPNMAINLQENSYERLEFLGDSVIHMVIANYLYKRYPDQDEGFMTKLRTKIENGDTLSYLSKKIGLNEYMIIARNIEQMGGRNNNVTILEDIFEAFIGALYIESNFEICNNFLINVLEKEIDFANMIYYETNYKDMLMQYFHTIKWKDPIYHHHETLEEGSKRKFVIYVKQKETGEILGKGIGTSKKKAEKIAAKNALKKLGVSNNSDNESENNYFGEKEN